MRLSIVFTILVATLMSLHAADTDNQITYHKGDFASAKRKATRQGKQLFIEFYISHCGICNKLEKQSLNNPKLVKHIGDNFIALRLDGQSFLKEGVELAVKYHVRAYPTVLVLDAKGKELKSLEGFFMPQVLQAELTDVDRNSSYAMDLSSLESDGERKILKRVRPGSIKTAKAKSTGNALALFFSEYGLEVEEFESYGEAQDAVRIWDVPWEGEIWIIPVGNGHHKLVLGPIESKAKAMKAKEAIMTTYGVQTDVLDITKLLY